MIIGSAMLAAEIIKNQIFVFELEMIFVWHQMSDFDWNHIFDISDQGHRDHLDQPHITAGALQLDYLNVNDIPGRFCLQRIY